MVIVRSRQAAPAQLYTYRGTDLDFDQRSADFDFILSDGYAASASPAWALGLIIGLTSGNDNRIASQSHAREGCPQG